ncbi:MAG: hypothetical protein ACP5D2_04550 [Candidatus Nanoarchaeia archaeon]
MGSKMSKKGQVTIFIIIAILIVAAIVAFFLLYTQQESEEAGLQLEIESCVRDVVDKSVDKVLAGAGMVSPVHFKLYQGGEYNYLCYQENYYHTCINQYPLLRRTAEEEILDNSLSGIRNCIDNELQEVRDNGYDVDEGSLDVDVHVIPREVEIEISKQIDISKGDFSQSFNKFDIKLLSPLYELIHIAQEVVNQESEFCNFEYNGFMLLYPKYKINRFVYDESRLYRIEDRQSGKVIKFAVRSCAFPPGL